MDFLVKFTLEGEGEVEIEARDAAAAQVKFDGMSLEELVDHADFTGGVDVVEIVSLDGGDGRNRGGS